MKVTATVLLSCYGELNGISVLDEEDMEEDMEGSEEESSEVEVFEVENVLDQRKRRRSWEYLVKWVGYGLEESTWEPASNLEHLDCFQEFKRRKQRKTQRRK